MRGSIRRRRIQLGDAVQLIKSRASAKFDETVEIAMNLNLDPRKQDQNLRGTVMLPHGTGKTVRVAVFARGDRAKEAEAAGADVVGAEDLAEKVQAGNIDFYCAIATPDLMALVGRLGKILGPRGLMPNPRLGTVTQNVGEAVRAAKGGQVEFRAEKAGLVHAGVGKASFTDDALADNVRAFVGAITRNKPAASKAPTLEGHPELDDGAGRQGRIVRSGRRGQNLAARAIAALGDRGDGNARTSRSRVGEDGGSGRRRSGPSTKAKAGRDLATGSRRHGLRRGDAPDRAHRRRSDPVASPDARRRRSLPRDQEPAGATGPRQHPVCTLSPLFTGPTAIAFSRDPVAAAKVAVEYTPTATTS